MNPPWSRIEKLREAHDIEAFSCGYDPVDEWLHNNARSNPHSVATHICLDESDTVRGFFALKTVIVQVDGYSSAQRRGANAENQSVGILLCQMGLLNSDRGLKIGPHLLKEAFLEAAKAHYSSPVQLFIVDAANEDLVGYYESAGLKRIPNTLRLALPMKAVVNILAAL